MRLLSGLLRRFVEKGRLTVIDHTGARHVFGSGVDGPLVVLKLHDAAIERDLFFNAELKAGEAYMDGRLTMEEGGHIHDLMTLFAVNRRSFASHPVQRFLARAWKAVRRLQQANPLGRAAENVRSHYDHPAAFYKLWLDETMSYSCAYFERPDMALCDAQIAKMRHIAAKLDLKPGMRVLDIGSGWGGLAIYLARNCGADVTGLNVSPEQIAEARRRVEVAGLADRIRFVEKDYREFQGSFDRVVSVGMMEHVGVPYFDAYFGTVKNLLVPGGVAMIHAIGRMAPPSTTAPFIRKYIFPGGYTPSLSEVYASTERTGLWVSDCEILRLHYAWTIQAWREAFAAKRDEVVALMGERFARMWEFYLSAVELTFVTGPQMVYQLLLSRGRDDVPLKRDYITDEEQRLRAAEAPWPSL